MFAPQNYNIKLANPGMEILRGLQQGEMLTGFFDRLKMRKRRGEMMDALRANPTLDGIGGILDKYPEFEKEIAPRFNRLSEAEKQNSIRDASKVAIALKNNRPDYAKKFALDMKASAEQAKDDQGAMKWSGIADMIDKNPQTAMLDSAMNLRLIMGPDKYKKFLENSMAEKELEYYDRDKQSELKKSEYDNLKLQRELAEAVRIDGGMIAAEKRPEFEVKLRNQYLKETSDFQGVSVGYDKILSAQNDGTGDVALIFNYMKMLDPTSVVREGEFKTAQKTAGISDQVWGWFKKIKAGDQLTAGQRKAIKTQAKKVFESSKAKEKRVRRRIGRQANNYDLNIDNIFYEEDVRVPGEIDDRGEVPKDFLEVKVLIDQQTGDDYFHDEDGNRYNIKDLTKEELKALENEGYILR